MINMTISDEKKMVYIDVNGYITSKEAMKFTNDYKIKIKNIKPSSYRMVVTPSNFECESEKDLRNICMMFFKNNYRGMYLVDPQNTLLNSMRLGKIEQKMFNKVVKVIPSISYIK